VMMMMMMMIMTQMKLVNSATKFRHGMDKFTNLIQVYAVPEAWTRLYIHMCVYIYIYIMSKNGGATPRPQFGTCHVIASLTKIA